LRNTSGSIRVGDHFEVEEVFDLGGLVVVDALLQAAVLQQEVVPRVLAGDLVVAAGRIPLGGVLAEQRALADLDAGVLAGTLLDVVDGEDLLGDELLFDIPALHQEGLDVRAVNSGGIVIHGVVPKKLLGWVD
jgi:hypothetical protein